MKIFFKAVRICIYWGSIAMCLFPQFFFLSSVRLNQLLERQGGCVAEVDCFRPSQCEWKKVTTQNGWMLSCHLVMPRSLMGQFLPSPLTSRFCRNGEKWSCWSVQFYSKNSCSALAYIIFYSQLADQSFRKLGSTKIMWSANFPQIFGVVFVERRTAAVQTQLTFQDNSAIAQF